MKTRIAAIAGAATLLASGASAARAVESDGVDPPVTSPAGIPALAHSGLFYVGGRDDPVEIVLNSTVALGIEADGTTIRGGVSMLGNTGSLAPLDGPLEPCYLELAPSRLIRHLTVGRRYVLRITLGDGPTQATFVKTKTLVRDGSVTSIRRQMDC